MHDCSIFMNFFVFSRKHLINKYFLGFSYLLQATKKPLFKYITNLNLHTTYLYNIKHISRGPQAHHVTGLHEQSFIGALMAHAACVNEDQFGCPATGGASEQR